MAEITASMIKELRERTGVGMSKCKEALDQNSGNMEEAISWLRKQGVASAVKKADREAKEGKIAAYETPSVMAVVEVGAETDFVANNGRFIEFLESIAKQIAETNPKSLDELLASKYIQDPSMTVEEFRGTIVQAIGENIQIKRFKTFAKGSDKSIGIYSHMGGKILTLIEITGSCDRVEVARDIAMHAAAASPDHISPEMIPEETIEHEREIARAQLEKSGKPQNIWDKIVEGKVNAFYDQVCLLKQKYIRDEGVTIAQYLAKNGKDLKVTGMLRWTVGEG